MSSFTPLSSARTATHATRYPDYTARPASSAMGSNNPFAEYRTAPPVQRRQAPLPPLPPQPRAALAPASVATPPPSYPGSPRAQSVFPARDEGLSPELMAMLFENDPTIEAEFRALADDPTACTPHFDAFLAELMIEEEDAANAAQPAFARAQPAPAPRQESRPYMRNPYVFLGGPDAAYENAVVNQFTRQCNARIAAENRVLEDAGGSSVVLRYEIRQGPGPHTPTISGAGMSRERFEATTQQIENIRQRVKGEFDWNQFALHAGLSLLLFPAFYCIPLSIARRGKKVTYLAVRPIREFMLQENRRLQAEKIPLHWKLDTLAATIPTQCEITLTRTT